MGNRKISICITTYNRPNTIESFKEVLNDERVLEVIICDDCSDKESYSKLLESVLALRSTKIKVYRNNKNLGVYANKREVMSHATCAFGINFDSDNKLNKAYLDAIYSQQWDAKTILAPTFAKPNFDYRAFAGIVIDKNTVEAYLDKPLFEAFLNTFNFFINREEYLKTWEGADNVNVADSIYFNYLWLRKGGSLFPLAGLEYEHKVHEGSNYLTHLGKPQKMPAEVKNQIRGFKHDFVTTKLYGRLGNQCYQIAACIATAMRNGVQYLIPKQTAGGAPLYFNHFTELLPSHKAEHVYKESSHAYSPIPYSPNMCLDGYWQSHKYWEEHADVILPLFGINPVIKTDTVGIHRRLGDYKGLQDRFVMISDDYIRAAIKHYNKKGYSKFMVFSDEIELCKTLFTNPEFKDNAFTFSEGKTPIEDMAELSGCAHQICSASTFSYWATYFNPNKNKTCILPNKLWGERNKETPQEDMFPPHSIRLNN